MLRCPDECRLILTEKRFGLDSDETRAQDMDIAGSDFVERGWRQALGWLDKSRTVKPHASPVELVALCRALLSPQGEAQGRVLATQILKKYAGLDETDRLGFLAALADDFGPEKGTLDEAIRAYQLDPDSRTMGRLHTASQPRRQQLIDRLNLAPGGTQALVNMRSDLLRMGVRANRLEHLDADFASLFASWFNAGFLNLREITWSSPAAILRQLIRYEAVHKIADWDDLRRRLEPPDRRCFAYFHPAMTDEPLIFVEIALTTGVPSSIQSLLEKDRVPIPSHDASVATFYSISTCQDGLRGIPFGNFLIKRVVEQLRSELSHIRDFVTLSPSPKFATWLRKQGTESHMADDAGRDLLLALEADDWEEALRRSPRLHRRMRAAVAHYYLVAKGADGRVLDPVARFHLGNGARLERIVLLADMSEKGRHESFGVMVNYCYQAHRIIQNHAAYAASGAIVVSRSVQGAASPLRWQDILRSSDKNRRPA